MATSVPKAEDMKAKAKLNSMTSNVTPPIDEDVGVRSGASPRAVEEYGLGFVQRHCQPQAALSTTREPPADARLAAVMKLPRAVRRVSTNVHLPRYRGALPGWTVYFPHTRGTFMENYKNSNQQPPTETDRPIEIGRVRCLPSGSVRRVNTQTGKACRLSSCKFRGDDDDVDDRQ